MKAEGAIKGHKPRLVFLDRLPKKGYKKLMGNEKDAFMFFAILLFLIVLAIIVKAVAAVMRFNNEVQAIERELRRADNADEYRYWRRELRFAYLRLIPFVSNKNIMRVYAFLYHRRKGKTDEKRNGDIYRLLAPCVIGAAVCAICLCGASWAWFTASSGNAVGAITTPKYEISVTAAPADAPDNTVSDYSEALAELNGKTYTVILKAEENGTFGAVGYCRITVDGTEYFSEPLSVGGESLTFEVTAERVTIERRWGTRADNTGNIIRNSDKIRSSAVSENNKAADKENISVINGNIEASDNTEGVHNAE